MLDSKRILELIRYPARATAEEQTQLMDLSQLYAYSALVKIVNAKVASVNQLNDAGRFITSAAIATVDRSNLKKYMQAEDWAISTDSATDKQEMEPKPAGEPDLTQQEAQTITVEKTAHEVSESPQPEEKDSGESYTGKGVSEEKEHPEADTGTEVEPVKSKDEETGPSPLPTLQEVDKEKEESRQTDETDITAPLSDQPNEGLEQEDTTKMETGWKWNPIPPSGSEPEEKEEKNKPAGNLAGDQDVQEPEKKPIGNKKSPGDDQQGGENREKIPDLSEKKFEPVTVEKEEVSPTPEDPLSSDLLKNIQEYRKNREFFEKMLQDDHPDKENEKPADKKKKAGKKSGKKDVQKSVSDKKSAGVKKNAEKTGHKIKTADKKQVSQEEEKPDLEDDKRLKPEHADRGQQPEEGEKYRSGIADDLEEVTEEIKSEGYPVNEEEDPEVIREFLEKLNPEPDEGEMPKKMKKEEQVKIIENFIRSEPRIKNVKEPKKLKEREDLSLPSVKFRDDLVSENLANIMISQGKTDQAIDIYKKLIWKFPQKKSYFASQIEELKKK